MSLLHKKGWNKLRVARTSIAVNTVDDINLKIAIAKNVIKQINIYLTNNKLRDETIPVYGSKNVKLSAKDIDRSKKKTFLLYSLYVMENKLLIMKNGKPGNNNKYKFKWLGDISQLEKVYKFLKDDKLIKDECNLNMWKSNFIDKDDNDIGSEDLPTPIMFNGDSTYLITLFGILNKPYGYESLLVFENQWAKIARMFFNYKGNKYKQKKLSDEFIRIKSQLDKYYSAKQNLSKKGCNKITEDNVDEIRISQKIRERFLAIDNLIVEICKTKSMPIKT